METSFIWITKTYLETILQNDAVEKTKSPVSKFTITSAIPLGLSLLSETFRIQIDYTTGDGQDLYKYIIVKSPAKKEVSQDLHKFNFYDREPKLYECLLPKMSGKLNEHFGPKLYPSPVLDTLVLEDLTQEGYASSREQKNLNFAQCKAVFIKIAKFHASSVACFNENPDAFELSGKQVLFTNEGPLTQGMKKLIKYAALNVIQVLSNTNECDNVKNYLENNVETIWQRSVDSCKPKPNGLNVLNHGDLWTSNILFKYDNSKEIISDVKFIDYQMTNFSTPINDLQWFIWTSAAEDVVAHQLTDLYDIYLQALNSTLELLGCEQRMTQKEFQSDLKAAADFTLLIICHQLPIFLGSSETDDTLNGEERCEQDQNSSPEQQFEKYYTGKYYRSILPSVCKRFGVLFL